MDLEKMMQGNRNNFGEAFVKPPSKKKLNHLFFLDYLSNELDLIFSPQENSFFMYDNNKGVWEKFSDNKMRCVIKDVLLEYFKSEYSENMEGYITMSILSNLLNLLKGEVENATAFQNQGLKYIHCINCVLEYDEEQSTWEEKEFSPHYYSRKQKPVTYNPESRCTQFIEKLLAPAMTQDDIDHLQMYLGQCLLGINLSQTFLLLIGTAGGGKSTLVNIIEGIIGRRNCTELRLGHMDSRFEINRYNGYSLLTGKDVNSNFLNTSGSSKLKSLTGNDTLTGEPKCSNAAFDIIGNFNVIITSNSLLKIMLESDINAWRRRMLLIKYDKPATNEVIVDFDQKLLKEEGSGILNWALEGAVKLLKSGGKIEKSKKQQAVVNNLLKSSRPFEVFAELYIHPTLDANITTEEVVTAFSKFCNDLDWPLLPERKIQMAFHEWMRSKHTAVIRTNIKRHGTSRRGYSGFQIRKK